MRASSGGTREFCLYPQGQERVLQVKDKGTTSKHEKPKLHLHEATHRRSKHRATETQEKRHQIGHQSLHVPPATSGGMNHSQDSIPSIPRPYPPRLDRAGLRLQSQNVERTYYSWKIFCTKEGTVNSKHFQQHSQYFLISWTIY